MSTKTIKQTSRFYSTLKWWIIITNLKFSSLKHLKIYLLNNKQIHQIIHQQYMVLKVEVDWIFLLDNNSHLLILAQLNF